MKQFHFKLVGIIVKVIKALLYFVTTVILLGLILVLLKPSIVFSNSVFNEFLYRITYLHAIIVLVAAILIQIAIIYFLTKLELLLNNFSKGIFFTADNRYILNKMLVALVAWTIIQFLTSLILNYLNLYEVSDIFNFNIKNYLINFIFIGTIYTFRVIVNYGINKQEEYDQII